MMSERTPIRVMVVDDHPMLRQGLVAFIEAYSDLQLVGQADNGVEALRLCEELQPDVILMDLIMPEMGGPAAIHTIHVRFPAIQIIAFTSIVDEQMVRAALQAGASGYLLKTMATDKLADAIRTAHEGQPVLAPEAARILIKAATKPTILPQDLTPREHEVLALMVAGDNNSKISERLGIGRATVKTHVSNIIAKLGATSRVEAVILALQLQLHQWPSMSN